jgi:hypothetical protein
MSLIISALTFSLSAILAPPLQEQSAEIPSGIPHPTLPQPFHRWEDFVLGDIDVEDLSLWHRLDPGDLLGGTMETSYRQARLERADMLAGLNDWSDQELQNWISMTAPKPVQIEFSVTHLDGKASAINGGILAVGSQPLYPGEATTLGQQSSQPIVSDLDVEIASGSSIADPEMRWMFDGVSLAVAAVPVGQNQWWIELALTVSQPDGGNVIDTGHLGITGKGRENARVLEFSGPILADAGQPARVRLPGLEQGSSIEVKLQLDGQPQPAVFQAGDYLAVDLPTMPLDPGLSALLKSSRDNFVWSSPVGMMIMDADSGQMIAEELAATAADVVGADLALTLTSRRGSDLLLLTVPGVVGRDYTFAAGQAYDVLTDWDVEVASESRIPDPTFSRVFEGVSGLIRAHSSTGGLDGTELDIEFSTISMGRPSQLKLGGERLPVNDTNRRMGPVHVNVERPIRTVSLFQWNGALTDVGITKSMPKNLGWGDKLRLNFVATESVDG